MIDANLSDAQIDQIAPKVPDSVMEQAEATLQKIEARMAAHASSQRSAADAIAWLREYAEPAHVSDIVTEVQSSSAVAALVYAAKADAIADQDPELKEFEEPTADALSLLEDPEYARRFGQCLGYAVAGVGVSWSDDHAEIPMPDLYYCTGINDHARDIADSACAHNKPESEED